MQEDLQISSGDVYRCIQFARTYPQLEDLEQFRTSAKKLSWKFIRNELLPANNKEPEEQHPETRLGELLSNTEKQGKTKEYGSTGGTIPSLPIGINKKKQC